MNTAKEVMEFVTIATFANLTGEITLDQDGELNLYLCDEVEWHYISTTDGYDKVPESINIRLGNTHDSHLLARLGAEVHRNQISTSRVRLADDPDTDEFPPQ